MPGTCGSIGEICAGHMRAHRVYRVNINPPSDYLPMTACLLYRTISNQDDANRLQDDLVKLKEWTDTWQMNFNAKKCYLLSIHSKRDPALNRYRLNGEEIVKTSHHSYLGVALQDDGKWTKHIEKWVLQLI